MAVMEDCLIYNFMDFKFAYFSRNFNIRFNTNKTMWKDKKQKKTVYRKVYKCDSSFYIMLMYGQMADL